MTTEISQPKYVPPSPSTNILDINYTIFSTISHDLDEASRWRDLVSQADSSRYKLSLIEVEECARVLHCSMSASPSEKLLKKWALMGMNVKELVILLDRLRIEKSLMFLRNRETLRITVQPPKTLRLNEGERLQITCNAVGFPYPNFVWFCEKKQLSIQQDGGLVIDSVSLANTGRYICRVHHNYHGEQDHKFTDWCNLVVTPSPRTIGTSMTLTLQQGQGCPPCIREHPQSQGVRLNDSFRLNCSATGDPPLFYYWIKDSELLSNRPTGPLFTVSRMTEADAGSYQCLVKNILGETRSNSAIISSQRVTGNLHQMNFNDATDAIRVPPVIVIQPSNQTQALGGRAVFILKATHPLPLFYQWFLDGKPLRGETQSELHINVTGRHVAGSYTARIFTSAVGAEIMTREAVLSYEPTPNAYNAYDKVALVFGISTYRSHGPPLPAVEHDIQHTVHALEKLKFRVISLIDLTLQEMKDAIDHFCDLVAPGVYVVFYCAGHGYQDDMKRHYLIPWDACHGVNDSESLCIDEVEAKIQARSPTLVLFFLDICRRNVGHINPQMPARPITQVDAKPNRCIFYAASSGQQSFEEKESRNFPNMPRGIFNQYFVEVVQQRLKVGELFPALQDKFLKCPYDRVRFPQHPEITNNIEEHGRSLWDPIDEKMYAELSRKRKYEWDHFQDLPLSRSISIGHIGQVNLTFRMLASNVIEMSTTPVLGAGWTCSMFMRKEMTQPVVQPVQPSHDPLTNVTSFRFPNIQRLRTNLILYLGIRVTEPSPSTVSNDLVTQAIDLGMPFVAQLRLGFGSQGVGVDMGVDRRLTSPPVIRQPMEHSESETSLCDNDPTYTSDKT